ncbi:MAG: translocation/assembly module TamB [Flavobacteriales bacterium]|nr:translocation/assembly module TamB [Flavobacteriales bacterium]
MGVLVALVVFLVLTLSALLLVPYVQTLVAQRLSRYASSELGVDVRIGRFTADPFGAITLKQVYVGDLRQDTLFMVDMLKVTRPRFNSATRFIWISALEVDRVRFALSRTEGDTYSNLTNLLNRIDPDTTSSDPSDEWRIRCSRFDLHDIHFSFHDAHHDPLPFGVDVDHVDLDDVHVVGTGLDVIGDSITARLHQFSFHEQSGLRLDQLAGRVQVGPTGIRVGGMDLRTEGSSLQGDLELLTEGWSDHNDFIDKVKLRMRLDSSTLEFADVAYFAPELRGIHLPVRLSGRVRGTIADLKGRDMRISFGERSYFRGNAELSGLPDMDNTFMLIDIADMRTDAGDLSELPAPPFMEGGTVDLPPELAPLGPLRFSGNFTGFMRAFTAYGDLGTDLGTLRTDLSYERDTITDLFRLSGRLGTPGFELGRLLGTSTLGGLTADLRVILTGRTFANVKADLEGTIPAITVNGATITNVTTQGTLERDRFDGSLSVVDDDLVMDFNGLADLRGRWPIVDFAADVKHADLRSLGIAPRPGYHAISAMVEAKGRLSPDSLQGTIHATEISYCDDRGDHDLGYLDLESGKVDGEDVLLLDATFAEAEVRGRFLPTRVPTLLENMIYSVFPALGDDVDYRQEEQDLRFSITVREPEVFLGMFVPDLTLATGSTFQGALNSRTFDLEFIADIPMLRYGPFQADSTTIIMDKTLDILAFSIRSARQSLGDSTWIAGSAFTGKAYQDELDLSVGWETSTNGTNGDLNLLGLVNGMNNVSLELLPSKIFLGRGDWSNDRVAHIDIRGDSIHIDSLVLHNGRQWIAVSGHVDRDPTKPLRFELEEVALENITPYLGGPLITGTLGGDGILYDLYGTPILQSELCIDSLAVEDKPVGDIRFNAGWVEGRDVLDLSGSLTRGPIKALDFDGLLTLGETQELDVDLVMDRFDLTFIDPYLPEGVSEIQGLVTGTLAVTGALQEPQVNGELDLKDAGLRIDYLNTLYRFSHVVQVRPDMFALDLVTVRDEEGNTAKLGGTILHTGLRKWNYNVWGDMERFMVMNTTVADNDLYYGKAYATGTMEVSGEEGTLEVVVDARTAPGTDIHFPVGGSTEVSAISFVRFTSGPEEEVEAEVDLSGITLDLNVEVTPDALFELIFDPTVGDIMSGRGRGNMEMSVDRNGAFDMRGQVEVTDGAYLFTLRNVVNKRFQVEPGGTITWYGDPFDAQLDLQAMYKLRAPLYDMVPPSERTEAYRKRVPVEVVMNLRDRLMNPEINFEVRLPSVDESLKAQVASVLSTDQEMNRQVFALIVLNRFLPPPSYAGAGTPASGSTVAGTTGFELMSNQISNWLSQLSTGFDLGVNYRPGDNITQDELEVAVSTQLFNERLLLSTNLGVQYGAQAQQNSNSLVGDFQLEYLLTDDGKLRLKAFSISNDRNLNRTDQALTTQGAGIAYRRESNNFWKLFRIGRDK